MPVLWDAAGIGRALRRRTHGIQTGEAAMVGTKIFEAYSCPNCKGPVPRDGPRRRVYCSRQCARVASSRHNHMIWLASKGWKDYYQSGRAGRGAAK